MIRLYLGEKVPKFVNGIWCWRERDGDEKLRFKRRVEIWGQENVINTNGFKFSRCMDQIEEMVFLQEFQRSESSNDFDIITTKDIINLVSFLSPTSILTRDFLEFIHTETVYNFLRALIIYFQYYLKVVEFIVIRRDEQEGGEVQSEESNKLKRGFSLRLDQYRLLIAREYSSIILGTGEMNKFHHLMRQCIKDLLFHEAFLAFSVQVVWIAMHRRDYEIIDMEMNRLFRSENFAVTQYRHLKFSRLEQGVLYGKTFKRLNFRYQSTPLVQALKSVSRENLPILWIGKRKYRGNDEQILKLELEYVVPDSELCLIDVSHGILGHPKSIYDTMLQLNWPAVRRSNYTELDDPYHIKRQPELRLPKLNDEKLRKQCQTYESYYEVKHMHEKITKEMLIKWRKRNDIVNYFKTEGILTDIVTKCNREIETSICVPSTSEIIQKFWQRKEKRRKQ